MPTATQGREAGLAKVISGGLETAGAGSAGPEAPIVAALNLCPAPGDVGGNLLLAERAVAEAKRAHPALRWVVLPELFTTAYSGLAAVHRHAEDAVEGPSARFFAALARELDVHIAYGFPEKLRDAPGVSDSVNLVGPGGEPEILFTYRKRQLVRTNGEDLIFVPGADLPTVEAGGVRVAIVVCWDLGFPEIVREAALAGAELILAPAGWRDPWGAQYGLSCAARALDNAVHLASANQLGRYPEATFGARGGVYGPDGARLSGDGAAAGPGGVRSAAAVDLGLPGRWRSFYGDTVGGRREEAVPLEACS